MSSVAHHGMRYPVLGRTGMRISEIVLGSAGAPELIEERIFREVVAAALDHGVSAFDTADAYDAGVAEEWLGRALGPRRDQVVLATKVGLRVGATAVEHGADWAFDASDLRQGIGPNDRGLSRVHIRQAVEASLRRLGTDHLDLYQIHQWDPATPIEETLGVLGDLVVAGKIRYIGASRLAGWQLHQALGISALHRLPSFVSMQVGYNLLAREAEREVLPACAAGGVGVLAFSVLAGGMLGGRFQPSVAPAAGTRLAARPAYAARYWNQRGFDIAGSLGALAEELGRTPAQLALGWALGQSGTNATIVGADSPSQIVELLDVVERRVSDDEVQRIDGLTAAAP